MDKNDFFIKSQISSNIRSIEEIVNTGVFIAQVLRPFQEPSFISIILKLNDLLQKLNKLDSRIVFTTDIKEGDITTLVNNVRNAICHLDSPENLLDKSAKIKFVFNIIFGKGTAIMIDKKNSAASDYDDDIAFFYGEHRIYLKRHIIRALNESIDATKKLYPMDPNFLL